jgi:hypothetical protein
MELVVYLICKIEGEVRIHTNKSDKEVSCCRKFRVVLNDIDIVKKWLKVHEMNQTGQWSQELDATSSQ